MKTRILIDSRSGPNSAIRMTLKLSGAGSLVGDWHYISQDVNGKIHLSQRQVLKRRTFFEKMCAQEL